MTVICIDCRYLSDRPSGIGEMTEALVRYLPDLAPDLDFLFLRSSRRDQPLSVAGNVSEVRVKSPANGPATLWWLPRVVDLSTVDVFHAPFNICPAGLRMPSVTTIHDTMWLTNPDWCNPSLYGQIERRFYRAGIVRAFEQSDRIATVSAATRDAIVAQRPDIADKIDITLSGVSDRFRKTATDPETLQSIGVTPGGGFVLTVGQYAAYKNHEGAISAFARAFANREDISLVMVQRRNSGARRLRELANGLGVADRVHFTGPVSEPVLMQLYSGALALLHPSLCEGFGHPVAEAMACGCPVITSNRSAMPEVAGGAALLIDPFNTPDIANALRKLADDRELSDNLSERGYIRAGDLSWRRFAEDNLRIYRELLVAN